MKIWPCTEAAINTMTDRSCHLQVDSISQQPFAPLTPQGNHPWVFPAIDHTNWALHCFHHTIKWQPGLWRKQDGHKGVQSKGMLCWCQNLVYHCIISCIPAIKRHLFTDTVATGDSAVSLQHSISLSQRALQTGIRSIAWRTTESQSFAHSKARPKQHNVAEWKTSSTATWLWMTVPNKCAVPRRFMRAEMLTK